MHEAPEAPGDAFLNYVCAIQADNLAQPHAMLGGQISGRRGSGPCPGNDMRQIRYFECHRKFQMEPAHAEPHLIHQMPIGLPVRPPCSLFVAAQLGPWKFSLL